MKTRTILSATACLLFLGLAGCFEENRLLGATDTSDTSGYVPAFRSDSLPVAVTEISSGNAFLQDEFGDDPGWLEVTNTSTDSVKLGGFRLRGRANDGPGWRLPDTSLAAGQALLVFMSGRDLRTCSPASTPEKARIISAYGWSDSMDANAPGFSAVRPDRFRRLVGKGADGTNAVSAKILLKDNSEADIDWSGANVGIGFPEIDASAMDRFLLKGTFPAGQPMLLRLCSDNECWKHGSYSFEGTGIEDDSYVFPISAFDVDPSTIHGLQMDPPSSLLGTYSVYVSQIAFFKSERRPHAGFKLKRDGGSVSLEDTSAKTASTTEYPAIPATGSWALDPATGRWGFVAAPSPATSNPAAFQPGILAAPVFLSRAGFQSKPFTVRLAPEAGFAVRCRIDGGDPDASSPDAGNGILLDSSASVRCALFSADGRKGPTSTATFLLGEDVHLPVVSISVDPTQMFDSVSGLHSMGPNASPTSPHFGANFWSDRELAANVELFENGMQAFSLPAGIGIYGNWTRSQDKKAISVQFREKYGATGVEWPLFPHHPQFRKFKGFGLRANGSNSSRDYVRDGMMQSFMESRGMEYQLSRHVVFFINGRYWGIYEIREKLDPDYVETRFGIDKSTIDLVKNNSEVQAGSSTDWLQIRRELQDILPDDTSAWSAMAKRIDFDAFMDYNAAQLFCNNTDWPANNVRVWRRNNPPGPWRPMLFDLDAGLSGSSTTNPFRFALDSTLEWDAYPNGAGSNVILRRIASNPALRFRFVNRFLVQLATNLSPSSTLRAMDSITGTLSKDAPRDIARWNFDNQDREEADATIRNYLERRPASIRKSMQSTFKLDSLKTLSIGVAGGTLLVEGIDVGSALDAQFFKGVPIAIEAKGRPGAVFKGWSDGWPAPGRILTPGTDPWSLVAQFE